MTTKSIIQILEPDNPTVLHTVNQGQRMSQETTPTDFEKRRWTMMLLHACGANPANMVTNIFSAFELHRAVSEEVLDTDQSLQAWLRDVVKTRFELFGIKENKRMFPKQANEKFRWTNVYAITKAFFNEQFGIDFFLPPKQEGKCPHSDHRYRRHYIDDQGQEKSTSIVCKVYIPKRDDIELLLERVYARITTEDCPLEQKYVDTVLASVKASMAFKIYNSGFLQILEPRDEVLLGEYELMALERLPTKNMTEVETSVTRKRKRTDSSAHARSRNTASKRKEQWDEIMKQFTDIGSDNLDPLTYEKRILTPAIKSVTQRQIAEINTRQTKALK